MVHTAYIVDCVRTAGGRKNGRLSKWHPVDLGGQIINALVDRTNIKPDVVDDVIFGCVSQIGAQSANLARMCVLASKLPITVPGTTVDRQCGSSQQAVHFAAQAVMSGTQDCVIAGGVEVMSMIPIGSNVADSVSKGRGLPMPQSVKDRFPECTGIMFSQFEGAEILAKKCGVTRQEMDEFAVLSHARAVEATKNGYFKNEILPLTGFNKKEEKECLHDTDEGIRPGTNIEGLSKLKPLKKNGGLITAAAASQICDGASGVLICNERGLKKLGLSPRAKIVSLALAGTDPVMMLYGPVPASKTALAKANMTINDMDLYEVNEAFASVPLAWKKELNADMAKLNVNGGAMALGHPLGATGTKLLTTLVNELERRKKKYGLLAICEGAGTANATIIEICSSTSPTSKL
mmetsp:Transcript_4511/g.8573  ORF Transcript_4511/g.8573 Transcript_4511/m.8573 type:complete len:406 (+) Transcript_4511:30-1247(+)|eukprot:CAMPEP_0175152764 /NCGR_PEP_ID=MMETSP0087-20121206/19313_1 /TAXON_ID=136419 /ORGANISM="Unknown Unknown, Strain D1" /LENGTH=405 /DNA_ID=CAMNT_0016439269 /DNA_START=30 /DNA_END=1247 /DNA_ORIENTATION=+